MDDYYDPEARQGLVQRLCNACDPPHLLLTGSGLIWAGLIWGRAWTAMALHGSMRAHRRVPHKKHAKVLTSNCSKP